ncbi:helix-turn-helix domain-containing protein [Clostridium sp. C2-6-12]|uniref:helix-turn-helix domain-containing protein n=1 Tax=Clostridium sp. C2-6-12 TaxID=2698832 RepID=UPI00136880CA|nr:helix-turn-helix domain-containing protein [Clostridium sp. C2-6-12]
MSITIITTENKRLCPAVVYGSEDEQLKTPIINIDDIYDLLYKKQSILVMSRQYDQYGKELKHFHGQLDKSDIKAMFATVDEENKKDLNSIMTLSEAAKKWGLANGSTIRKAIERGKFNQDEIKQAGDVWITTYSAMEKVFGPIKNEDNEFIIYDDFETVYLTKAYYEYAQLTFLKGPNYEALKKDLETKYQYIKEVFTKGLNALRNNQKVIIKKSRNNQVRQVICNEEEYYFYIQVFKSRRNLAPELIDRLLNDLKAVSN